MDWLHIVYGANTQGCRLVEDSTECDAVCAVFVLGRAKRHGGEAESPLGCTVGGLARHDKRGRSQIVIPEF